MSLSYRSRHDICGALEHSRNARIAQRLMINLSLARTFATPIEPFPPETWVASRNRISNDKPATRRSRQDRNER